MKTRILSMVLFFIFNLYSDSNADFKKPISSPSPDLFSRFELLWYLPKGGIVAEIGVERGDFSEAILKFESR